jgi:SAM-dependent methyltransferase
VLDLACGSGRNGLFLAARGIPVTFADIRRDALDQVATALEQSGGGAAPAINSLWQVDFEQGNPDPLQGRRFGAVLVFRYLHRPLMEAIARAILPGGLVVYETFTVDQPRFGRPRNPDFLLRSGELPGYFPCWETLHCFEGELRDAESGKQQAIAQFVARKRGD